MSRIIPIKGWSLDMLEYSHLSHRVTSNPSLTLTFNGSQGSLIMIDGNAIFANAFLNYETSFPINILTASRVYSAAITEVVVDRAGIIFPALILTVSLSILSRP
jgi:hypothetical protein